MTVSGLRITARMLESRVHAAAVDSSNVVFVPPPNKRSLGGMMRFQQAMACLREGSIEAKPTLNEHGHWEFFISRFAANRWYSLQAIAVVDGPRVTKLFAILQED